MIEKVSFFNQPNCYRLANAEVELIVSTDFGPRILRYAFVGGENALGEYPEAVTPTPWGDWKAWGGHRLWVAPEELPGSYAPDNAPIDYEIAGDYRVALNQPTDRAGFEKQIIVELAREGSGVDVHHRVTNRRKSTARIAPWALTTMRGGGQTFIPLEPFRSHDDYLLPASSIVLWYFTDLTDPRLKLGRRFLRLQADPARLAPQKIGAHNPLGWSACHDAANRLLFVKKVSYDQEATYPDFGSNTETYAAGDYIELETLAPLVSLAPNESTGYTECWRLFRGVELGQTDEEIEKTLNPLISDVATVHGSGGL